MREFTMKDWHEARRILEESALPAVDGFCYAYVVTDPMPARVFGQKRVRKLRIRRDRVKKEARAGSGEFLFRYRMRWLRALYEWRGWS